MSVIITNRNKPKDCLHCWNHYDCDYYLAEPVEGYMDKNCPLKSVDGLIEKMQSEISKLRDYNTKLNQESDYYSTPEIQNVSGNIKGLLRAIEIIKEYCGMED